jgi:uncharacterized protein YjlB
MVEVEERRFAAEGQIPNNPDLPLLVYRGVLAGGERAAANCEALFSSHGWSNGWRNGIFGYHHFHSTAHEVLGIVKGDARVRFGGKGGVTVALSAGDVVVIPAGVAHKNEGASRNLLVICAYAGGRDYDTCTAGGAEALTRIRAAPKPDADPVYGARGPLLKAWAATSP